MFKKHGKKIIISVFLITVIQAFFITKIELDYDFNKFFPEGDPDLEFYNNFIDKFETETNFLLVGIQHSPSIFDKSFLSKTDSLSKSIKKLDHVKDVTTITNFNYFMVSMSRGKVLSTFQKKAINWQNPEKYHTDSTFIWKNKDLLSNMVSEDARSLLLLVKTSNLNDISKKDTAEALVKNIEQLLVDFDFQRSHVAGKIKAEVSYVDILEEEIKIFVAASIFLVVLFFWITYRSLWGIAIPAIVVVCTVIWCVGFIGMTIQQIDMMMILLPSIMFIVGTSDVVHIVSKYLEELRRGNSKEAALKTTFREVGLATFLTSFTTSIGFFTLITAGVIPVQQFGMFSGIGVIVAFVLAIFLLPSILISMPVPKIVHNTNNQLFWHKQLHTFFLWILKRQKTILISLMLISGASIYGISKIEVNSFLIDEVSDRDPLKQNFIFFDKNFSGIRPFEIAVEVKDTSKNIFSYEVQQEMDKVEQYLQDTFKVSSLFSPSVVMKMIYKSTRGAVGENILPPTKKEYKPIYRIFRTNSKAFDLSSMVTEDRMEARISGKMNDIGSMEMKRRMDAFYAFQDKNINTSLVRFTVTGSANLIDKNNDYLAENMLQGLIIAFIIISLIMGWLFKSLKMILLSLIPNITPLLILGAIIGYFDIGLKLSTSIIFTVAFGIAVDDTIHFMSKLKIELSKGKSLLYAIKRTFISTGKAIIVTSFVLTAGFLTFIFSVFNGTFYIGLLISITLIIAVIADMLLIPVLLLFFYRNKGVLKNKSKKTVTSLKEPV